MAGHSKWANIKHKKKVNDVKKSKLFSKLANDIKLSVNESNKDIQTNIKLKKAIDKALSNNMSKNIINNIISSSEVISQNKSIYSVIGKNSVSIIVECFDFNKNRMIGELRHLFSQYDMNLVSFKSIEYMYLKYEKISLLSEYNDRIILINFNDMFLIKAVNNYMYVDILISKSVFFILKKIDLEFDACQIFYPKNCLKLTCDTLYKLNELLLKLKKFTYIANLFYNF